MALAEQGATVTGIDILEQGLAVAKDKCRMFGLQAHLMVENILDYSPPTAQCYDAVIFFASLEHMLTEGPWNICSRKRDFRHYLALGR